MRSLKFCRHLHKVEDYVEANISDRITLHDVANLVGLSPSYFSRLFRNKTGIRFSDWLTVKRLDHAKIILKTRPVSITQASFLSGFGSLRAFERAFKKFDGVTPNQFRKSQLH